MTGNTRSRLDETEPIVDATSPAASSHPELPPEHANLEPPEQPAGVPGGSNDAGVPPLDVNGVRTVAVGTGLWLLAFVVLLLFRSALSAQGRGWWLWTCAAGIGLGLIGLEYCRRRRTRLAKQPPRPVETSPFGAAGL